MGKTNMASAIALQTKLYLYTSYVVGGRLPKGTVPEALYWDTADPYHYLRIDPHRDFDYAIFGGQDHKTGQEADTGARYAALEAEARRALPGLEITHRWSGQVVETNDGLPFIGETSSKQFAGTGYGGNGMTFGTLAGMMAHDRATGRANPWSELFDPGRTKVRGGAWDYVKENIDYPYYMIRDRFAGPEAKSLRGVRRGEGKIVELGGKKVAAYRDEQGKTTLVSAVCTHMGCLVAWNPAEAHVGLPVPRIAVHAVGQGPGRARGSAARARSGSLGGGMICIQCAAPSMFCERAVIAARFSISSAKPHGATSGGFSLSRFSSGSPPSSSIRPGRRSRAPTTSSGRTSRRSIRRELFGDIAARWFGPKPGWWPAALPFSPALLILLGARRLPLHLLLLPRRLLQGVLGDPPSCAVGEPRKSYLRRATRSR